MSDLPQNETRTRILDAADGLFSRRGYAAVTLRDIASEVGMRHASLYYYAPGGKEQLFVEVMERNLRQHRAGIAEAVANAGNDLGVQLIAVAHWLLQQPPLDFARMAHADLRALPPEHADRLARLAYAVHEPIIAAFAAARERGEIRFADPDLAALSFVSVIQGLHAVPTNFTGGSLSPVVQQVVGMMLDGWRHTP
jgi:AcrR family transcriptional regulator